MHLLCKAISLIYLGISLFGCSPGGRSYVTRISNNGVDQLYSEISVGLDRTRFSCIASDTGQCFFSLFPHDCPASNSCVLQPFLRLTVSAGDSQDIDTPNPGFQPCVSQLSTPQSASCLHPAQPG